MINKSSNILFLLLVASSCHCNLETRFQNAQTGRSRLLSVYSDTEAAFNDVRETLVDKTWTSIFGISIPQSNSYEELMGNLLFQNPKDIADSILDKYPSLEALESEVTKLVNDIFPDVNSLLSEKNISNVHSMNEAQKQEIKEAYFVNISKLYEQIPVLIKTNGLIKAAELLKNHDSNTENSKQLIIKVTIGDFLNKKIYIKLNEFVQATYIDLQEESIKIQNIITKDINSFAQNGLQDIQLLLKTIMNGDYFINNEIEYLIAQVESGKIDDKDNINTAYERIVAILNLFTKNYQNCKGIDRLKNLINELISYETDLATENLNTSDKNQFNRLLLQSIFVSLSSLGERNSVYEAIKLMIGSKYAVFDSPQVTQMIKYFIEQRPDFSKPVSSDFDKLFYLDAIAYSQYDQSAEDVEDSDEIYLTNDQIDGIAHNFAEITNISEYSIYYEVWSDSKKLFMADVLNFESNQDFFWHLYLLFGQFLTKEQEVITPYDWGMIFDKYIDLLATTSNDFWIQVNYFKLKVFNVFLYGAQTDVDFTFLPFKDNTQTFNGALEFVQNHENNFFKTKLQSVYRELANKKASEAKDLTKMLEFYSGLKTNTKYFAFLKTSIEDFQMTNKFDAPKIEDNLKTFGTEVQGGTYNLLTVKPHINQNKKDSESPKQTPEEEDKLQSSLDFKNLKKKNNAAKKELEADDEDNEPVDLEKSSPKLNINSPKKSPANISSEKKSPSVNHNDNFGLLDNLFDVQVDKNSNDFDKKVAEELALLKKLKKAEQKKNGNELSDNEDENDSPLRKSDSKINLDNSYDSKVLDIGQDIQNTHNYPLEDEIEENDIFNRPSYKAQQNSLIPSRKSLDNNDESPKIQIHSPFKNDQNSNLKSSTSSVESEEDNEEDDIDGFNNLSPKRYRRRKNLLELARSNKDSQNKDELNVENYQINLDDVENHLNKNEDELPLHKNDSLIDAQEEEELEALKSNFKAGDSPKSLRSSRSSIKSIDILQDDNDRINSPLKPEQLLKSIGSPNKINLEQRKNIVHQLNGVPLTKLLDQFRDNDILEVIREMPTGVDEDGYETEIVYVQVVNRKSPCYKTIYPDRKI